MLLRRTKVEQPTIEMAVPTTALALGFRAPEWRALLALRTRYQHDRDLFGEADVARLRFVRWLKETGCLQS